jgi:hypothetical protein
VPSFIMPIRLHFGRAPNLHKHTRPLTNIPIPLHRQCRVAHTPRTRVSMRCAPPCCGIARQLQTTRQRRYVLRSFVTRALHAVLFLFSEHVHALARLSLVIHTTSFSTTLHDSASGAVKIGRVVNSGRASVSKQGGSLCFSQLFFTLLCTRFSVSMMLHRG